MTEHLRKLNSKSRRLPKDRLLHVEKKGWNFQVQLLVYQAQSSASELRRVSK